MWWRHKDNQASKPPVRKILAGCNQNLDWRNRPDLLLCLMTDTDTCEGGYVMGNPTLVPKPNPSLSWPMQENVFGARGFMRATALVTDPHPTFHTFRQQTVV